MSEKYKFADPDGKYFITPTIVKWIDLFTKKVYCDLIVDSLKYCQTHKNLVIHAWCIMCSHLLLIVSSNKNLTDIIRDFKTFTNKSIIKRLKTGDDSRREWILNLFLDEAAVIKRVKHFKVWQDGNHPVLLDTNEMLDQRLHYLHNNPVKQGMVTEPEHYYYSSACDYAGIKGLLDIEMLD